MRRPGNTLLVGLMLDVGHGEYMPADRELGTVTRWDPAEYYDTSPPSGEVAGEDMRRSLPEWAKGLEVYDPTWTTVVEFIGPPAALKRAWQSLLADVSSPPSGDDDVFDYWPSGARLLLDMAIDLDGLDNGSHEHSIRALEVVSDMLADHLSEYADELRDKLPGLPDFDEAA